MVGLRCASRAAMLIDGAIEIGDDVRLVPDRTPRGAGRWTLETPRVREDPVPEGMVDSHGYGRAFPEGLPFGVERESLDLAWALARRLHGAVVTDETWRRLSEHLDEQQLMDLVFTAGGYGTLAMAIETFGIEDES